MNDFKTGGSGLLLLEGSTENGHNNVCIWVEHRVEVGCLVGCHATDE